MFSIYLLDFQIIGNFFLKDLENIDIGYMYAFSIFYFKISQLSFYVYDI